MAFSTTFNTETSGTTLENYSGWSIVGSEGLRVFGEHTTEVELSGNSGGSGTGGTAYICTDQGTADHYTIVNMGALEAYPDYYGCVRLVDLSNFIGLRFFGTGSSGRRLTTVVAGTETDKITSQGVADEWLKIECSGNSISFYEGGTGGSPGTWNQIGSTQTITDHNTETSQGLANTGDYGASDRTFSYFEAGALGGGGKTASGAATTGALTASGATARNTNAAGAATTGALTASGATARHTNAAGAATLGALTASGTAVTTGAGKTASGAATLGALTASGATARNTSASGAATVGALTASGAIARTRYASGAATLGALTASGATVRHTKASAAAAIAALTASGTATKTTTNKTASGAATIGALTASGQTARHTTASAAATIAALIAAGQTARHTSASGAATIRRLSANGTALKTGENFNYENSEQFGLYQPIALPYREEGELARAVFDELVKISDTLASLNVQFLILAPLSASPDRIFNGMVVRADGINWDPGSGAGVYCYQGGAWTLLG